MSQNSFTKPSVSDPLASISTPIAITLKLYEEIF